MERMFGNRFRVEAEIGSDTVASYYRCSTFGPTPQSVILKHIHSEILKDPHLVEQIRHSVMRFASPLHENVSRVLEFTEGNDDAYYLVEDFPGCDVYDWCTTPRPLEVVLPVLCQAARGLAAVHSSGIIHRNIKAEKILVADDGRVKLAESIVAIGLSDELTNNGLVAEIDNAPPEYFEDARFTVQGDIYALGIVAFELITGLSPFNGKTLIESMQMRLKGDIPSPRSIAPSCPEGVAEVIINATLKDPTKRYQKVLEFVENLERVMSKQAS